MENKQDNKSHAVTVSDFVKAAEAGVRNLFGNYAWNSIGSSANRSNPKVNDAKDKSSDRNKKP